MTASSEQPSNPSAASQTPEPKKSEETRPDSANKDQSAQTRKILIGSQRDAAEKILTPKSRTTHRETQGGESTKFGRTPAEKQVVLPTDSPADSPADSTTPPPAATNPPAAAAPETATKSPATESKRPEGKPKHPRRDAEENRNEPPIETPAELPEMTLDEELEAALGEWSVDSLMDLNVGDDSAEMELESRVPAKITRIHGDDVFCSLGGHREGIASLRQFESPPAIGSTVDVILKRLAEDGLYEVAVPGASIDVADWSDLVPGSVVEARVTGSNTGGLECVVNNIPGFIPASQIELFRVDQFADYVGQKLPCVVMEANESRRKLVVSRRGVLEREREANRQQRLQSLEVGQVLEGIVMKLMDFGAFVDIGGVEGLVHVSKLSWDRVTHPSEVLEVGQKIKVKIERLQEGGKISLSYRDTLADPWENVQQKYPVNSIVPGTVSRIAQFGAFVKLEPGVEGLVHISELAHHRVFAVKNVVKEGDSVEVKVLSIDREAQRMSLSMKATMAKPESAPTPTEDAEDVPAEPRRPLAVAPRNEPLKGGRKRSSGGEQFGLNW